MMLTGYISSAEAIEEVGKIARELKFKSTTKPGSFFWSKAHPIPRDTRS